VPQSEQLWLTLQTKKQFPQSRPNLRRNDHPSNRKAQPAGIVATEAEGLRVEVVVGRATSQSIQGGRYVLPSVQLGAAVGPLAGDSLVADAPTSGPATGREPCRQIRHRPSLVCLRLIPKARGTRPCDGLPTDPSGNGGPAGSDEEES
jgi:hypothetical protein